MHEKSCKNGCEFAVKFHLMSYAAKNADGTYSDADYLYTCTKLGHTIAFDSTVYKLGCATYNNVVQNAIVSEAEALVAEVEKKLDEIEKIIPVAVEKPTVPDPVIEKPIEPVIIEPTVAQVEPKFVPEPTLVQSEPTVIPAEKPVEPAKKRGRRTTVEASVVNPVVPESPKV